MKQFLLVVAMIGCGFAAYFANPNKTSKTKPEPYYRLYLLDDSISVMDGDSRTVVRLPYDSSTLSKAVLKDNE